MDGLQMVQGFIARGYSPQQAAALAGHALQESGGSGSAVNPGEDAHGILQFRGSRWQGLQDFAKSQGKDPTDVNTQMDYIGREMSGPEAKSSQGFLNATDVPSASAALKSYIRFGDDSAGKRLGNSMDLYNQYAGSPVGALGQGPTMPMDPTSPIDPTQVAGTAPMSLAPAPVGALAAPNALQTLGAGLTKAAGTPAAPVAAAPAAADPGIQQIAMAKPNTQAAQIAAAIAKSYGIGA